MAALEEFEKILKEVVNAKRLSASKMNTLTEIAMKNMGNDTQLVSILYRNHKSLPTVSKVSSLYIFDALSRAARHHVVKHGISGDAYTQPGNCATFLLKVGGVVEGLFQDMVTSGSPESKEKTKKILDIWVKGNTFPPIILSQLSNILKPTDKVPDPTPVPTIDPRTNAQSTFNPPATSPLTPPLDPQAALLALLTQAAAKPVNSSTSQLIKNMGAPPQLDATQLAVLQQLAHTAASVPSVSQTLPPPEPVNVHNFPSSSGVSGSSHAHSSSHRDEPHNMAKKEQRYNRFRSPENEIGPDPHFDSDIRGKYRGGLRSRGRNDNLGYKWDNRDSDRYRTSERDRSPPRAGRGGRSRSRSPPSRYGGRSSRFYSPSQRPRFASPSQRQESTSKTENDSGKDEFGRDIRPQSPSSKSPSVAHDTSLPPPSPPTSIINPRVEPRSSLAVTTNLDQKPKSVSPLVAENTASNKPSAPLVSNTVPYSGLGIDSFDLSTFDYTAPASWEALGKMWQVTYGYLPSTEQLMQFVISCGTGQMSSLELSNSNQQQSAGFTSRSWGEDGGFPYGNGRNMNDTTQTTDAIVLGGDTNGPENISISSDQKSAPSDTPTLGSSSGRMQRVGDKWVFVRGSTTEVS